MKNKKDVKCKWGQVSYQKDAWKSKKLLSKILALKTLNNIAKTQVHSYLHYIASWEPKVKNVHLH